jgi:uncharacterized protein YndB with AHSA1/START domain
MSDRLGELERSGEHWRIRFVRDFRYPAEKVWSAITEPEHLVAWFPTGIVGRIEPGAKLVFEDDAVPTFDGEVLAYEEPRLLVMRWGPDIIRVEIETTSEGCTLIFTDVFAEIGKASRDAAGWHECLDRLEYSLGERTFPWSPGERWSGVHEKYVGRFGPEGSTIGPPRDQ